MTETKRDQFLRLVEAGPLSFPYTHKETGHAVEQFSPRCPFCNEGTSTPYGTVVEKFGMVEFEFACVCHDCKRAFVAKVRWYPEENRIMVSNGRGTFAELDMKPVHSNMFSRFTSWLFGRT